MNTNSMSTHPGAFSSLLVVESSTMNISSIGSLPESTKSTGATGTLARFGSDRLHRINYRLDKSHEINSNSHISNDDGSSSARTSATLGLTGAPKTTSTGLSEALEATTAS